MYIFTLALIGELKYIGLMGVELFIGNLSYDTEGKRLSQFLGHYGKIIQCNIVTDKFTFRSKGYAKALAADADEASKVIEGASGRELDGRPLKVELFRKPD